MRKPVWKSPSALSLVILISALALPAVFPNAVVVPYLSLIGGVSAALVLGFRGLETLVELVDRKEAAQDASASEAFPDWREQVSAAQDAALSAVLGWQTDTFGEATNAFAIAFVRQSTEAQEFLFARPVPTDLFARDVIVAHGEHSAKGPLGSFEECDGTGLLDQIQHSTPQQVADLRARVRDAMFGTMPQETYAALVHKGVVPLCARTAPYMRVEHPRMIPVSLK